MFCEGNSNSLCLCLESAVRFHPQPHPFFRGKTRSKLPFFDYDPKRPKMIRPRKDRRGVDLISDALPFGALWYDRPDAVRNAIGYAKFYSRSLDAVIRVYDEAGKMAETHEHAGHFKEP